MQTLTAEQKQIGQDNYYEAVGVTRRDFIKGVVGTGAVTGAGLGAMYFGYGKDRSNPVRDRHYRCWRRRQCAYRWLHA